MSQSSPTSRRNSPAERLQTSTAAVRLSLRWFGVRKTLSPEQKAEAAGKKLGEDNADLWAIVECWKLKESINQLHPKQINERIVGTERVRPCDMPRKEAGDELSGSDSYPDHL